MEPGRQQGSSSSSQAAEAARQQNRLVRSESLPPPASGRNRPDESPQQDNEDKDEEEVDNERQQDKHQHPSSAGRVGNLVEEAAAKAALFSSSSAGMMDGLMAATARRDTDRIHQLIARETRLLNFLRVIVALVLAGGAAAGISGTVNDSLSWEPSVLLLTISALLAVLLGLYDVTSTRRLRIVMDKATKSAAIASALLARASTATDATNTNTSTTYSNQMNSNNHSSGNGVITANSSSDNNYDKNDINTGGRLPDISESESRSTDDFISPGSTRRLQSNKMRLKTILKTELSESTTTTPPSSSSMTPTTTVAAAAATAASAGGGVAAAVIDSTPIADFFPHCTVMFADIAGFTAWSSQHEPSHVFTLLQNIFYAFDAEAKKRDVFKVETIGDSYVAVTGLPEPQPDHAIVMTLFALECRKLLRAVTHELERTLGPSVAELKMRFGLHSGAVTAGVMRGERSRFQLFGDTVNIASGMESTGLPDMIQISDSTATLLMDAGKTDWVRPREDPVAVRGKGDISTYWILPIDGRARRRGTFGSFLSSAFSLSSSSISTGEISIDDEPRKPPRRTRSALTKAREGIWGTDDLNGPGGNRAARGKLSDKARLVDWNVDALTRLLKLVEAKRRLSSDNDCSESTAEMERSFRIQVSLRDRAVDTDIVDEVQEIITLPTYDPDFAATAVNPDSFFLDEEVQLQLRDYVTTIASMYRDNPFHNYEHACHVQMSMVKLLQRVVHPEEIDESSSHADLDMHKYTYGITSDPLIQFTVVFCALIHDVDHTGVTNGQLIKENAHIASVYKNKSVAEQNSVDLAWDLLMDQRYTELRNCIYSNQEEFLRFRQLVVNVVLATDIFDKELSALRKNRWSKAFNERDFNESSTVKDNRKATIVIEHLIQASDVAHTMQHWEIYRKWNERLFYEMYLAFKSGRTDSDPSEGWYKGELWFFDNYVIPLAKKLRECDVFGVSSDECLNYAMENRRLWEMRGEQIVADMLATDYYDTLKDRRSKRSLRRSRLLKVT